jgi:hypothetical protein
MNTLVIVFAPLKYEIKFLTNTFSLSRKGFSIPKNQTISAPYIVPDNRLTDFKRGQQDSRHNVTVTIHVKFMYRVVATSLHEFDWLLLDNEGMIFAEVFFKRKPRNQLRE